MVPPIESYNPYRPCNDEHTIARPSFYLLHPAVKVGAALQISHLRIVITGYMFTGLPGRSLLDAYWGQDCFVLCACFG